MMLSGNSLLKRPIIAYNSDNIVGYIEDVLIDPFANRLAAFVTNRSTPTDLMVVPWTGVKTLQPDQIIVWASSMLVRARDIFELRHLLQREVIKRGTQFKSDKGDFLGEVTDTYINERTGELAGYEVVGGMLTSDQQERGFLPVPDLIAITQHEAIAHLERAAVFPAISQQMCLDRLNRATQELGQQWREQMEDEMAVAEYLLSHLVGCAALHTITTVDDYILVVQGQVITNKTLQYAQRTHSALDLLGAVDFDLGEQLAKL